MPLSTDHLVLTPDSIVDLHLHTVLSDGDWQPEELMDYLVQEHFELVAITDHDRADTAERIQQLALECGLPVLVGVEMTTKWRGEMTDLLCYGYRTGESPLKVLSLDVFRRQCDNTREVYGKLRQKGYSLPDDPAVLNAIIAEPSSKQPFVLRDALQKYGNLPPEPSAGCILFDNGCDFATTDLAAVVDAAHQSGAVCLLAHPGRGDGFMVFTTELLDDVFSEIPIDGLEVYHTRHDEGQRAFFLGYAQKHNLLVSSGSDSHRPEKKPVPYPASLSRALLERLGIEVRK